jgi:putative CocE/NonD family hydrolase
LLPREEKFLFGLLNDPAADPLSGEMQVKYFLLGENQWYESTDWPPPGVGMQTMYLHSGGNANCSCGDGIIDDMPPTAELPDNFISNPNDPVTTLRDGSNNSPVGCYDRSYMETRPDMLVYTSEKFTTPLKITGNVRLRFFASVTAPDADFFATLTDVTPEGKSMLLTTGMVRARFAKSLEVPELLTPGEIYQFEIDLGDTAVKFLPGHALRLELCGQEFPAFDRNAHTGNTPMHDTVLRTANVTVYHDAEHPAELILPVLA